MALPNPFLAGTETPPAIQTRAVKTTQIPLTYLHYVDEQGEVSHRGTFRWPKNRGENGKVLAGAVILTGNLKDLPAKGLAAARLFVPVTQAHNKAAGKLGLVFLKPAVTPGKIRDVAELGDTAATVILPKQPEDMPEYQPARWFALEVTRPIKAVASGAATFNGLALRMVPDRGTDEGWTIRRDLSPNDPIYLEVDVYADGF
jgi:hypothetical protein